MCGRLACGLEPEEICNCCCYKTPRDRFVRPQWTSFYNQGKFYRPSYNICPTEVAPVLMPQDYSAPRSVAPMIFGVIPSWDKKSQSKRLSTFNCRMETIGTSRLFGKLFKNGQRCVVVCSGFYEWQRKKKPYFVHAKQSSGIVMNDPTTWDLKFTAENGSSGLKLLRLAALFSVETSSEGSTYSFAIITREASTDMTWLHNRMPLFVETEDQLNAWLGNRTFDSDVALTALIQNVKISWFEVSSLVSNVKNKKIDCIKPIMDSDGKKSNVLTKWLKKKPEEVEVKEAPAKKPKEEDEVTEAPTKKPEEFEVKEAPAKKPKEEDDVKEVPKKKLKEENQIEEVPKKKLKEEDEVEEIPVKKKKENDEC